MGDQAFEQVGFVFKGKFKVDSFMAFARHRAGRLGLTMNVILADEEAISLGVTGVMELLDAFEMACSLGPYDCLVLDVARHARDSHVGRSGH